MKAWQTNTRSALLREGLLPAKGTLEADVLAYLKAMARTLGHPEDRKHEIDAWRPRFGQRRRHTIKKEEIRQQVKDWQTSGVAASRFDIG